MKIEQFRQELTTEQLNDRLSKVFGTSIDLDKFSTEQLQTAQSNVVGKIANIEQSEPFDGLSHNEDYHKQKMFLDVITSAIQDRQIAIEGYYKKVDQAADEMLGDYVDAEKEALKMKKDAVAADIKSRADKEDSEVIKRALEKLEIEFEDDGTMKEPEYEPDGPMEGNAFAQAVQKAKAAGMKKGDKFKIGDKEYTLQDCENLIDEMKKKKMKKMDEKSKPDYIDLDKDGNKTEPMKKAAKDKEEKKKVKEGAEEGAQLVMAAKDMVDKVTGWMEDTASMQSETILELGDAIRDEEGSEKSEQFINAVKPALESLYTSLEATREALTGGVAVLTGENAPDTMGADAEEPAMEPTTDADADMPDQSDDFSASEPASGGEEPADREKREHIIRLSRRLAETLSKKKA
ncbi:hypothetical protein [uncultured virus]|uniref:Uncharacterized protein n=1 Tax=uncultured virus TaxID=340016 RepID=A0A218MN05_9VIRU|nr:hypothetical protein [uncultured virus]